MKVGMFLVREGKQQRLACYFLCARCDKRIEDLSEANFAPVEPEYETERIIQRGLRLVTDKLEIWHWDCDHAGVPWINVVDGLAAAYDCVSAASRVPI